MDDTYRLKIKIGVHEFEAEGPVQVVQAQFAAFKELVAMMPTAAPISPTVVIPAQNVESAANGTPEVPALDQRLDKIMRLDDRVISLTARPDSAESAILLLLYGQKTLRQNDAVTGGEVVQGIAATGGLAIHRADRMLDKLARDGDVIVIGERRSRRYRMTNSG